MSGEMVARPRCRPQSQWGEEVRPKGAGAASLWRGFHGAVAALSSRGRYLSLDRVCDSIADGFEELEGGVFNGRCFGIEDQIGVVRGLE